MKKINYLFTLGIVLFITIFSFFNMFQIVSLSSNVLSIVLNNLIPSLLPFMILLSLCLDLGLLHVANYVFQFLFYPLFHLSPTMSSIYFVSFFCGYPTNFKIIKEAYELNYVTIDQVQHLLHIACFSSFSFLFVSLTIKYPLYFYLAHILPSIFLALTYRKKQKFQTIQETITFLKKPHCSFVQALKRSLLSSIYAFIFILGYLLVFQFIGYSISHFIDAPFFTSCIQGVLEFSSGSFALLEYMHTPLLYSIVCFNLSFGGLSVMLQLDNLFEDIPYSSSSYLKARLYHGVSSFILCYLFYQVLL